ncbi:MAG TPA: polysaccharide biosynthesis protein [Acidobacteriaceae bacterium]|nr:polysaccharide biosynthesis protein [Acidobacteriaceae bacterium]
MDSMVRRAWVILTGQSITPDSPLSSITVSGDLVRNKRILITGAGGSIGSALAHAVAARKPAQILLLEASEQALYAIDRDLAAPHTPILASAGDTAALDELFALYRPHIVFHAAAFKHVPLMELHPFAALQNNAVATFRLAQTAINHNADQIILVSTDKAVSPASIMGASKRIAELTTLALATSATQIKAVRLGNVYASQGSVVQLFTEQLAQRRPVTVTDPRATRYFLTVEETAALLLFALAPQFPSGILVPELAAPIRVDDLARALIHAANSDSPITYIGLRPGEKLHEQLLSNDESFLDPATNSASAPLRSIRSTTISVSHAEAAITALERAIAGRNLHQLLFAVSRLIPPYQPSNTVLAQQSLAEPRA